MPHSDHTPNPNRRTSITARMTMYYSASLLVFVVLVVGALLTSYAVHQRTVLQERISAEVTQLFGEVLIGATQLGFNPGLSQRTGSYVLSGDEGLYVRLLGTQGEVIDQSANFAGQPPFATSLPTSTSGITEVDFVWQERSTRSLYAPVFADSTTFMGWIEVSGYRWEIGYALRGWLGSLGLGLLIAFGLAVGTGYSLARRALKPVAAITEAIQTIQATDLSIRLPEDRHVHDELTQLGETFNAMLHRLEAAFERERRFIANAAHQLLNPLTNMRNVAEVALRRVRPVSTYEHTLEKMLSNVVRVTSTVERLLQLSRAEAITHIKRKPIDLSALCQDRVHHFQPLTDARDIALSVAIEPTITIAANANHIEEAVTNVLENALKYTPAKGTITFKLFSKDDVVWVTVQDTGIGFDHTERERLFERFFRSDSPEVQLQAGTGLGLSIVQTIVQHYDGTVIAESTGIGKGSTFSLTFPAYREQGNNSLTTPPYIA